MATTFRTSKANYSFLFNGKRIIVKDSMLTTDVPSLIKKLKKSSQFQEVTAEELAAREAANKPYVSAAAAALISGKTPEPPTAAESGSGSNVGAMTSDKLAALKTNSNSK